MRGAGPSTGRGGRGRGRGRATSSTRDRSPNHSPSSSKRRRMMIEGGGHHHHHHHHQALNRPGGFRPSNHQGPSSRRSLSLTPPPNLTNRSTRSPIRRRRSPPPSMAAERPPRRERDYAERGPPPPPDLRKHWPPPSFDDEGMNFHPDYMLPDHPTDLNDVSRALLKSSRNIKDKDFAVGPSASFDDQRMLLQKSLLLDDGSKRSFYTVSQDSGGEHPSDYSSAAMNPSDNMRSIGLGNASGLHLGMPCFDQRPRDHPYIVNKEMEDVYSKDVPFPTVPPPSQTRPFGNASSSSFAKDANLLNLYSGRGINAKFAEEEPSEFTTGYNQAQHSDHMRRPPVNPPAREKPPLDYDFGKFSHRGRDDHNYLPSDDSRRRPLYEQRGEYRDSNKVTFLDISEGRVDGLDAYHKKCEDSFWDQKHYVRGPEAIDFHDFKEVSEDYVRSSRSGYDGLGPRSLRDHELPPYEDSFHFRRDVAPVVHRERANSPLLVDHSLGPYRYDMSPPRGKSRMEADLDAYDPAAERTLMRNFHMVDDPNGRNVHRRIQSGIHEDELWFSEEYEDDSKWVLPSKKPFNRNIQNRLLSHKVSRRDGWGPSRDSSAHEHEGRGSGINIKKRLRTVPSVSHDSSAPVRRQEFLRPHKVWKRGQDDWNGTLNTPDQNLPLDVDRHVKNDPPEDSEEFKQQVHKAFLRFSKLLNDSPHHQKRFRDDQGKFKVLCCVCGSNSKDFVDIHSLLTHTYHTLKPGLRTEHLGFHKALCILNDWNWLVTPDTSKAYKRSPPSDIKALKEDLILWPPVIIVHNSSIANRSKTNHPKVISVETLEEMLKEKGFDFDAGKIRVCRGKPANQSVLLVKFMPTLSGLQEAERLQKFYADSNRGRQGLQRITSGSGEVQVEKDEEVLYGYMAVAEDLDKLDPETKKRSLVKSKRDIEAIADAPLKID